LRISRQALAGEPAVALRVGTSKPEVNICIGKPKTRPGLMLMLMLVQAPRPACRMLATDAAIWHTS
jgi:hypothetical protein